MDKLTENLKQSQKEEARDCFQRLIEKNPELKQDVLKYFASVDPMFFLQNLQPDTEKPTLHLVSKTGSDISSLGININPSPEKHFILPPKKAIEELSVSVDPMEMTIKELYLYFSSHFYSSEETIKKDILNLFFEEHKFLKSDDFKSVDSDHLKYSQNLLNFPDLKNNGSDREIHQYYDSHIIDFPQKERNIESYKKTEITKEEALEKIKQDFQEIIFVLSQNSENLLWFSGINPDIKISDNIQSKINDLDFQIQKYETFNYLDFLESSLSVFIHYYFPYLVTKESLKLRSQPNTKERPFFVDIF